MSDSKPVTKVKTDSKGVTEVRQKKPPIKRVLPPKVKREAPLPKPKRRVVETHSMKGKARFADKNANEQKTEKMKIPMRARPLPNKDFVKTRVTENIELVDQNLEQRFIVYDVSIAGENGDPDMKVNYVIDQNQLFYINRAF